MCECHHIVPHSQEALTRRGQGFTNSGPSWIPVHNPHYYCCFFMFFLSGAASGAVFIKSFGAMSKAATLHPAVIDASVSHVIPTWR